MSGHGSEGSDKASSKVEVGQACPADGRVMSSELPGGRYGDAIATTTPVRCHERTTSSESVVPMAWTVRAHELIDVSSGIKIRTCR